jgi:hypothetical protein
MGLMRIVGLRRGESVFVVMILYHQQSRERVHAAKLIRIRLAGSLRGSSNLPGAFPGELSGCANTFGVRGPLPPC